MKKMGSAELGSHYLDTGDPSAAYKAYARMRDFCTSSKHIAEMCLKLTLASIEQGNWISVESNVQKIWNLQLKAEEELEIHPRLHIAMGLAQMSGLTYRDAAASFLQVDPVVGSSFNELLVRNDVAVYGGLCALASMDREELRSRVLESASFRNFLEVEPHIRRAIASFCNSNYSECLAILDTYKTDYLLDVYLQAHVQQLYGRIRRKSIVQYFIPFSCVSFENMAKAFKSDERAMEMELVEMIQQGVLNARIDTQNRVSSSS